MPDTRVRLPTGVRDFLPRAARRRRDIAERILTTFESWGYQRIITPLFECVDVLERGLGHQLGHAGEGNSIRFIEPKTGEVVVLRPDITPQVARIAATRMDDMDGPVRFAYEGPVARMGAGARGQREIMQAGVEFLGAKGPAADAELLALAAASLEALPSRSERSLDFGHAALARYAMATVEDQGRRSELLEALRRKDPRSVDEAARGLPKRQRDMLGALPILFGDPKRTLKRARQLQLPKIVSKALDEMEETLSLAKELFADSELLRDLTIDLGELRGFDYYTGMRIGAFMKGAGGPVLRGGRYDELVARYGRAMPATGFAIDIEAVAEAEAAAGTPSKTQREGFLILAPTANRKKANRLAQSLRRAGMRAVVDSDIRRSAARSAAYAREVDLQFLLCLRVDGHQVTDSANQPITIPASSINRAIRGECSDLLGRLLSDSPSQSRQSGERSPA